MGLDTLPDSNSTNECDSDEEDDSKHGYVNISVYIRYFNSMGVCILPLAVLLICALVALSIFQTFWLAHWMNAQNHQDLIVNTTHIDQNYDISYYFLIYTLLH